jgi:hypothetical protein
MYDMNHTWFTNLSCHLMSHPVILFLPPPSEVNIIKNFQYVKKREKVTVEILENYLTKYHLDNLPKY